MGGRPHECPILIKFSSFSKRLEVDVKLDEHDRSQNWIVRKTFAYRREEKERIGPLWKRCREVMSQNLPEKGHFDDE
jgi:hypothetical protein